MKPKNIIMMTISICCMLNMVACEKAESVAMDAGTSTIASVLKLTGDNQLTAFNMLSSEQKVAVRTLHIKNYQRRKIFNAHQNTMINEFLAFNKPEFYEGGTDQREYAINYFAKDWLKRASEIFQSYEVYTLMFSLEDVELAAGRPLAHAKDKAPAEDAGMHQLNPDRSPYNNESFPNCFCAVGSLFTCPQFGFKYNTVTKNSEISLQYNSCTYAYTQPCDVEGGCGFGGWSTCDGNRCS